MLIIDDNSNGKDSLSNAFFENIGKKYIFSIVRTIDDYDDNGNNEFDILNIPNFDTGLEIYKRTYQINVNCKIKKHILNDDFLTWLELVIILNPGIYKLYYFSDKNWKTFEENLQISKIKTTFVNLVKHYKEK